MAMILALGPVSCLGPQNAPSVSDENDYFKVAPMNERIFSDHFPLAEDPLLVNPETRDILLYGAGGETVAFQLIAGPGDGGEMNLAFSPMTLVRALESTKNDLGATPIEPSRWRVYRVLEVPISNYDAYDARLISPSFLTSRSYPDPLAPIFADENGRFVIPGNSQGQTLLWVEVDIPSKTPRAMYTGEIRLEWSNKKMSRPVRLRTWGFDLPNPGVDIFGLVDAPKIWLEHEIGELRESDRLVLPPDRQRTEKLAELIGEYCRLLDEHGIEPWLTRVFPKISGTDPASMYIDWEGYSRLVEGVLKNSNRARQYWPIPADLYYPSTQMYGPYSSELYGRILKNYLRQFNETLVRPGLIGSPVAIPIWSDSFEESVSVYHASVEWMKQVRESAPPAILVHPFITTDLAPMGWPGFKSFDASMSLAGAVCPEEKWLDPAMIGAFREQGTRIWWRLSKSDGTLPTLKISYPSYFPQAIAWTVGRYETSGVMLGRVNDWPGLKASAIKDYGRGSGNILIYPGEWFGYDKPLGSIRLKMIKRGLMDAAYLKALKNAGRGELADWLTKHLVRFAHADAFDGSIWTVRNDGLCNREQAWMLAPMIAGLELDGLGTRSTASQPTTSVSPTTQKTFVENDRLMQRLYESQFRDFAQGLALETQGVRAKNVTDVKTGRQKIEWSFHLVARNFREGAEKGIIGFESIASPLEVVQSDDSLNLSGLSWAWPVRSTLKLQSPGVALGMFGVNTQWVQLKLKDDTTVDLECRYCALAGGKLDKMVRIDGHFDDWPEMPSAVAGGFIPIRSDGINDRRLGQIDRVARRPTLVQIGYDERNLYLAFTCYQPDHERFNIAANTVECSAGMPWGEDLVAVVLDPDNTASLNPLDAYQVIVKGNGNVLTFRGTLEANRMRASERWPNQIRAAVANFPDRWQAEIGIPLADVDGTTKLNRWWGIDFARVSAAVSELSTWSGTANQYARPVSMGNVFLAK